MLAELKIRAQKLRLALIDGDQEAAAQLQAWLMGEVAAGLIEQESEALLDLRAAIADLPQVADRYGEGKPGDRWRAVWELLYAVGQTSRPMEQQRLVQAETLSGQLLRLIGERPGIAPSAMGEKLGKNPNHVSNTLRTLLDQGLVFRVPRGRAAAFYLTAQASALLAEPVAAPSPLPPSEKEAANDSCFPWMDTTRQGRAVNPLELPGRLA